MIHILCRKCQKEIDASFTFCPHCGTKQEYTRAIRKRSSGEGTVYKDGKGKWVAEYTLGWDYEETKDPTTGEIKGNLKRKKHRKKGFATRKEALEYIPILKQELPQQDPDMKFKDLYKKWLAIHEQKVTPSTIGNYKAAYKYFIPLHYVEVAKIRTEHLQKCIDDCPNARRTKENMKALGTSLWRYAMQLDLVDRNYAEYIYIAKEQKEEKQAFSAEQLQTMWNKVNDIPELKYILTLCYTGMRLGEMLEAKTENYNKEEQYFIAGSKTAAGRDRIITISPKILPFFDGFGKGEYLFFADKKPAAKKFREETFYIALQKIDLDIKKPDGSHLFTPHCCRHTFATMMKDIKAPNTDKQKLIGHSSFEMTAHYTHTDIDSLKKITDNI